jgi:hypothetical protein
MSENTKSVLELSPNMNPELAQALHNVRNAIEEFHKIASEQNAAGKENSDRDNYAAFHCTIMYGSNGDAKFAQIVHMNRVDTFHVFQSIKERIFDK